MTFSCVKRALFVQNYLKFSYNLGIFEAYPDPFHLSLNDPQK